MSTRPIGFSFGLAILLFSVLPTAGFVVADTLKPPPMTAAEEGGSTTIKSKGGGVRSKSQWTMRHAQDNGHDAVKMTESGQGTYSEFDQQVRWNLEAWWTGGNAFRPLRFEKTVTDLNGKVLARERKQFDWTRNEVRFEREDLSNGRKMMRVLQVPADTLTVEGIAGALRSLPFGPELKFPAHFLSNEPKLYSVTFEMRDRETIRTSAGNVDCYKIELVPHIGALGALRFLVPRAYFWMAVAPPHKWVKYQGPENGPGTPDIIME